MEAMAQGARDEAVGAGGVMILCACGRPVTVLAGDEARPCATCAEAAAKDARQREAAAERKRRQRERDRLVREAFGNAPAPGGVTLDVVRAARVVVSNRERQRRFRVRRRTVEQARRNGPGGESVTPIVIRRHYRGADLTGFVDPPPEREIRLPEPRPEDRECACGRSLNLGRYKTEGDTCGTCKRERRMAERERAPWYVTPEELARQLEDDSPLPEDDDDE